MSRKPAGPVPVIAGFTYLDHLGSGGFADVFLFEQHRPSRKVAVKVLHADRVDDDALQRFDSEADLMALLSTHANIVTIYQTDVTADGRPYLVMEYCPRPNLGVRFKREPFGVAEALHTAIQVAGAVETVHRAGILHRDIKPANVLVTEYNRPVLTDFGISVVTDDVTQAQGMSIPWSPPEALADSARAGAAADVYSLAATLYTLLAGRPPFELPGGDNSALAVVARIETHPVPRLGRADVPPSLEQVLATAMAKDPSLRYSSALTFARALQQVQTQLALPMTPLEIREEAAPGGVVEDDDDPGTRVRGITEVDPAPQLPSAWDSAATAPGPVADRTVPGRVTGAAAAPPAYPGAPAPAPAGRVHDVRAPGAGSLGPQSVPRPSWEGPGLSDTVHRMAVPAPAEPVAEQPAPTRRRARTVAVATASVLVLAAAGVGTVFALRDAPEAEPQNPVTTTHRPVDALGDPVPAPAELTGTADDDGVLFSWTNPDSRDGDVFLWRPVRPGEETAFATTEEPSAHVETEPGREVCVEVVLRRADGQASPATTGCATS